MLFSLNSTSKQNNLHSEHVTNCGSRIPGVQTTLNISYLLTFNKRWEPRLRTRPSQSNKAHPLMSAAAPAGNDTIHSAYQMAKLSQWAFEAAFVLCSKSSTARQRAKAEWKQTLLSSTKSRRNALVPLFVCILCCIRTSLQLHPVKLHLLPCHNTTERLCCCFFSPANQYG